jgi:hypothetical protein
MQEVPKTNEKHNADVQPFCFETRLVLEDAVKRFKELALDNR